MKAFRSLAIAAALLTSAPALATPSTSSVSFKAGITYDANGLPFAVSTFAGLFGFEPHDPDALTDLDGLGPVNTVGVLVLTDYSLNVPDPNVPVTLSLGIDLDITTFAVTDDAIYNHATQVTSLPPFLDPFAGMPPVTLNTLTGSLFGVTFPDAATLEAEILETIGELADLIPHGLADPSVGGFATGDFGNSPGSEEFISGPGILGALTADPLPLAGDLLSGLGVTLPFDLGDLETVNIIIQGTLSLTATPKIADPPPSGPSEVPVPAPLTLLGAGIAGLVVLARKRRG